jgi:hypothetical protein
MDGFRLPSYAFSIRTDYSKISRRNLESTILKKITGLIENNTTKDIRLILYLRYITRVEVYIPC